MISVVLFEFVLLEEPSSWTPWSFHGMPVPRKVLIRLFSTHASLGHSHATIKNSSSTMMTMGHAFTTVMFFQFGPGFSSLQNACVLLGIDKGGCRRRRCGCSSSSCGCMSCMSRSRLCCYGSCRSPSLGHPCCRGGCRSWSRSNSRKTCKRFRDRCSGCRCCWWRLLMLTHSKRRPHRW